MFLQIMMEQVIQMHKGRGKILQIVFRYGTLRQEIGILLTVEMLIYQPINLQPQQLHLNTVVLTSMVPLGK